MKPPIEKDAVGSRRRIVVMGGSFNPPTMAHLALLRAAFGDGRRCARFREREGRSILGRRQLHLRGGKSVGSYIDGGAEGVVGAE